MAQWNFSCNKRRKGWGRVKSKKVSNEGEVVRRLSRSPRWRVGESMHCSCVLCNQYAFQKNLGWELRRDLFKESSSFLWEKKKIPQIQLGWQMHSVNGYFDYQELWGKNKNVCTETESLWIFKLWLCFLLGSIFFFFFNLSSSFWISAYLTFPIFIVTWKSFL